MQASNKTIGEFLQGVHSSQRENVIVSLYKRVKPDEAEQKITLTGFHKTRELVRIGTVAELLGEHEDIIPLDDEQMRAHYEQETEGFVMQDPLTGSAMLTITE